MIKGIKPRWKWGGRSATDVFTYEQRDYMVFETEKGEFIFADYPFLLDYSTIYQQDDVQKDLYQELCFYWKEISRTILDELTEE